jgi:hypothetical protein
LEFDEGLQVRRQFRPLGACRFGVTGSGKLRLAAPFGQAQNGHGASPSSIVAD